MHVRHALGARGALAALVRLLLLVAVVAVVPVTARPAAAGVDGRVDAHAAVSVTDDAALAQAYRPQVLVRRQATACGGGEPYFPAPVSSVLGRPDVVLRDASGAVVKQAPTAADLFDQPEGYYLDLPGNPLDPKCEYERWWDQMAPGLAPTLYARVATDPDHPDKLVVQYWAWWVFNDWNDKHEGDWEMIQLVFDATSPAAAAAKGPELVMYAQHEGGQYKVWDDSGLRRKGDAVAVYAAAGSHAAYFSADRFFGKSGQTGFGCDDTRAPVDALTPEVVLLPSQTSALSGPQDPFAWLTFLGRWGQKEPSFNNGPQGPVTKTSWATPVRWVDEEGRTGAVALPPLGTKVTDFFCTVSAAGSLLFITVLDRPVLVVVALGVLVTGVVLLLRRTRWRPSDPVPVARTRRTGQQLTAAARLSRAHPGAYARLGLVVVAGGALAAALQAVALALTPLGDVAQVADERTAWAVPVALLAGALVTLPVAAFVLAVAAALVLQVRDGEAVSFAAAARRAWRPAGGFLAALLVLVLSTLLLASVVLTVVAAVLLARWAVAPAAGVAAGRGVRAALRRSSELTASRRLRSFAVVVVVGIVAAGLGPLLGTLVLLLSSASFALVNVVAALVGAVTLPWAGNVLALLHEDLVARERDRTGDDLADSADRVPQPS